MKLATFGTLVIALIVGFSTAAAADEAVSTAYQGPGMVTGIADFDGQVLVASTTALRLLSPDGRVLDTHGPEGGLPWGGVVGLVPDPAQQAWLAVTPVDVRRVVVRSSSVSTTPIFDTREVGSTAQARIVEAATDGSGLWLSLRGGELVRYEGGRLTTVRSVRRARRIWSGQGFVAVAASNGELLVCHSTGCRKAGVLRAVAAASRDGELIVVGQEGVVRCRRDGCSPANVGLDRSGSGIAALGAHPGGLLAVTYSGDVQLLSGERPLAIGSVPATARPIVRLAAGQVWVGGRRALFQVSLRSEPRRVVLSPLAGEDVSSLSADDDGNLWVGMFDAGVGRLRPDGWVDLVSDHELPSPQVNRLAVFGPDVLVATARGLARIDRTTLRAERSTPDLPCADVHTVLTHGDVVYVGLRCGLVAWEPGTGQTRHFDRDAGLPNPSIFSLVVHDSALVVGTYDGLAWAPQSTTVPRSSTGDDAANKLDPVFTSERRLDGRLPDNWITALSSYDGRLWIGTYSGGVVVREGQQQRVDRTIVRVNLGGITNTRRGLLVGGLEEGLASFDPSPAWLLGAPADCGDETACSVLLPAEQLAPRPDVTAIAQVGDLVWVGTRHGIFSLR